MVHAQCTYNILKDALLDSVVLSHPTESMARGSVKNANRVYIYL